jgi:hypothetical protein
MSKEEIHKLAEDFKANSLKDPSLIKIIEKFDNNKDGIQDTTEEGVSGITVTLYDETNTIWP